MTIFELIFSLNVSEFAAPDPEELRESVNRMHACNHQQASTQVPSTQVQDDECDETNIIRKYLQLKEEHGGPYVEFQ